MDGENNKKNDKNNLSQLKHRLYKKGEVFNKRLKRRKLGEVKSSRSLGFWQRESHFKNKENLEPQAESWKKQRKKFPIFWVLTVLFILLVIVGVSIVLYFYGDLFGFGGNVVSSRNIDLKIEGPSLVESGESNRWYVSITNNNDVSLELADIIIEYPQGTLSLESESISKERRILSKMAPGETKQEEIQIFVLGEEGEQKEINITLEYRMSGSNAIFAKKTRQTMKLSRSPVGISINLPEELESGQEITANVTYISNSESLLKDVYLKVEYPPGFVFSEASPAPIRGNNIWKAGDLMPQEKRNLEIKGTLEGQDSMELSFSAFVGTLGEEDKLNAFNSVSDSVFLKKSFFNLSFLINNTDIDHVVGDRRLTVIVPWKNNTATEIHNATIGIKIKGDVVDIKTVSVDKGFYRGADDTIVWNSSSAPDLVAVVPGESGSVKFSFNFKKILPFYSVDDKNLSFVLEGEVVGFKTGLSGEETTIKSSASREIKISSEVQLTSGVQYSSGNLPPKVGQKTTYTVTWSVENQHNDVTGATVRALIPVYISWEDGISPSGENINYNSVTGEIVWRIDKVDAGAGVFDSPREVSFQISLLPAPNQANKTVELVDRASFEGKDSFTGVILRDLTGTLTTASAKEARSSGNSSLGRVIE